MEELVPEWDWHCVWHRSKTNTVKTRTCWRRCRVSWFLITCNWWIIAFSRLCLSSIVGAAPITDRILSMTSPLTWHNPTSGAIARSSPFPLPPAWSEYPFTSGPHPTPDWDPGRRWSGDRRAGTAFRFLADIVPENQSRPIPDTGSEFCRVLCATLPTRRRLS